MTPLDCHFLELNPYILMHVFCLNKFRLLHIFILYPAAIVMHWKDKKRAELTANISNGIALLGRCYDLLLHFQQIDACQSIFYLDGVSINILVALEMLKEGDFEIPLTENNNWCIYI